MSRDQAVKIAINDIDEILVQANTLISNATDHSLEEPNTGGVLDEGKLKVWLENCWYVGARADEILQCSRWDAKLDPDKVDWDKIRAQRTGWLTVRSEVLRLCRVDLGRKKNELEQVLALAETSEAISPEKLLNGVTEVKGAVGFLAGTLGKQLIEQFVGHRSSAKQLSPTAKTATAGDEAAFTRNIIRFMEQFASKSGFPNLDMIDKWLASVKKLIVESLSEKP